MVCEVEISDTARSSLTTEAIIGIIAICIVIVVVIRKSFSSGLRLADRFAIIFSQRF